jgi:hypothetical protein
VKMRSAKQLLTAMELPLSAHSFFEGLRLAGMIEAVQYESSTGSGEIKEFNRLLDSASAYGKNKASGFHPIKTEMQFFEAMFLEAYLISCSALHDDAKLRLAEVMKRETL